MGSWTARRLTGALLPLVSMGLILGSLAVDDWYSLHHIEGIKAEGEIWEEYNVTYGLIDFQFQVVWSGILGDNYAQYNMTSEGELGELGDYMQVSLVLLLLLQIPLVIMGFISALGKARAIIPLMLSMVIFLGMLFPLFYYPMTMPDIAREHVDDGFSPVRTELEPQVKVGLEGSGRFGNSLWILAFAVVFPLVSMLLFIDLKGDRTPSEKDLKDQFFK